MDPVLVGIMGVLALFVLLALEMPIAWALGIVGSLGLFLLLPGHVVCA